jgi:hypothetical protein
MKTTVVNVPSAHAPEADLIGVECLPVEPQIGRCAGRRRTAVRSRRIESRRLVAVGVAEVADMVVREGEDRSRRRRPTCRRSISKLWGTRPVNGTRTGDEGCSAALQDGRPLRVKQILSLVRVANTGRQRRRPVMSNAPKRPTSSRRRSGYRSRPFDRSRQRTEKSAPGAGTRRESRPHGNGILFVFPVVVVRADDPRCDPLRASSGVSPG